MSLDVQVSESRVERWRTFVIVQGVDESAVAAAETRIRGQVAELVNAGLDSDEAFLIALKRVAENDEASRAFASMFSGELLSGEPSGESGTSKRDRRFAPEFRVMLGCALAAALAIKAPTFFGLHLDAPGEEFFMRNVGLLVLPFLAIYFAWTSRLSAKRLAVLVAVFSVGAVIVNAYPFNSGGSTEVLASIHLPIALWLATGVAYVSGEWRSHRRRMEYVRFTGEWIVNYTLIALGGGVLVAITLGVFDAIDVDVSRLIGEWVLPCGAAGAVIVAAWLVETRRNLASMAPMLARVFTPLFAIMLAALLVGVVGTRGVIDVEREVLILFDVLLVVVLALLLYALSARDPLAKPGMFDRIQLLLVGCALAVDVFALLNIAARLAEYGFSANKAAALGLNLILLVNLVWSAVLQARFLRSTGSFEAVERWQMRYLPVYALWAIVVVALFGPLFRFV